MENRFNKKSCPQCGTRISANVDQCQCGHHFRSIESFARALEDERLYQEYLAARTRQAVRAAIVGQAAHKADPNDAKKASQAEECVREAETARAALAQQNAKVVHLVEAINKYSDAERATLAAKIGRQRLGQEAERIAKKVTKIKFCPRCKAAAPLDISRCKCGNLFSDVEHMSGKASISRIGDDAPSNPAKKID